MRTFPILLAGLFAGCATFQGAKATKWTIADVNSYGEVMGLDAKRGRQDALSDIENGTLRIIRYDMPPVRAGAWSEYFAPFEELGIEETSTWDHPKVYCEAYNRVMDTECKSRFGRRYTALRSKILPPQGAIHWVEAQERIEKQLSEQE